MTYSRSLDSELSCNMGRNTLLLNTCRDNITFILAHPELMDKLDKWQSLCEELTIERDLLRQTIEDCYLKEIKYREYKVVPGNYLLTIETDDELPAHLLSDWRAA